ncbi:MAG: chloride channel protein [Clostridia bacterium]|nr:chloride channel protein [Clostridia bacterium]
MKENKKEYKYKEYIANVMPCIFYGVVCGVLTGAFTFFFKVAARWAEEISRWVYSASRGSWIWVSAVFCGLVLFGSCMALLHKKLPEVKGGGIPRSEGVLRGVLSFKWLRTLVGTFVGSMMSYVCGAPLGSEGPAVLMGTAIGGMCGSISRNRSTWSRYVMTGGAGAGFAVATGSPFSGILFALEEIHKRFTPMLVLMVSVSVVSATSVNRLLCSLFGMSADLFDFESLPPLELGQIGYLLICGLLIALGVGIFDGSIALFGRLTARLKKYVDGYVKTVAVFVITGLLGFLFTDAVYSGHDVIHHVTENNRTVIYLAVLVAVRLIMMLLITDSGVTGGIFIPTLAIGALIGALIAKLLVLMGMPPETFPVIVILSTCGFIGGTLRAPLTATVLFVELSGSAENLFFAALVVFTVNAVVALLNQTPFYDMALEKMEEAQNRGRQPVIAYFEMRVSKGAFVIGKTVRDIMWPASAVVTGVTRADEAEEDMDHDGEKKLLEGDTVILRAKFYDEEEIRSLLCGLVGKDHEIIRKEI